MGKYEIMRENVSSFNLFIANFFNLFYTEFLYIKYTVENVQYYFISVQMCMNIVHNNIKNYIYIKIAQLAQ